MSTTTLDVTKLTDEQLATIVAEQRKRKTDKARTDKYAKFEPTYSDYRKSVVAAKSANDLKKSLLADLKKLGFGQKTPKATTAGKTYPRAKGGAKKDKI